MPHFILRQSLFFLFQNKMLLFEFIYKKAIRFHRVYSQNEIDDVGYKIDDGKCTANNVNFTNNVGD